MLTLQSSWLHEIIRVHVGPDEYNLTSQLDFATNSGQWLTTINEYIKVVKLSENST